jgi:hypothetical protein
MAETTAAAETVTTEWAETSLSAGLRPGTRAGPIRPPALYRVYRAAVAEHSILCPRNRGLWCSVHGHAFDHRIAVTMH